MSNKNNISWKAREYKPYPKSADWYWIFWISILSIILVSIYFFDNYAFAGLMFLIGIISNIGHIVEPTFTEYSIKDNYLILDNGKKKMSFDKIESYNIDYDEMQILINTKNKYQRLIHIPFENGQNIEIIDKVLNTDIKKDEEMEIPFLEKVFLRMIGF